MSAELDVLRKSAAAVVDDFCNESYAYIDDKTRTVPQPDYIRWSWRLATELVSVLVRLEAELAARDAVRT